MDIRVLILPVVVSALVAVVIIGLVKVGIIKVPNSTLQLHKRIIVWDRDGTITHSENPLDNSPQATELLPGVIELMEQARYNIIVSGFVAPRTFDPEEVIKRLTVLMDRLPVQLATIAPTEGGVDCYVIIKKGTGDYEIRNAHEDPRYAALIGHFRKPEVGQLIVLRDLMQELYAEPLHAKTAIMVGDMPYDEQAARSFGLPFLSAERVHHFSIK